jgi:hypothetical protein
MKFTASQARSRVNELKKLEKERQKTLEIERIRKAKEAAEEEARLAFEKKQREMEEKKCAERLKLEQELYNDVRRGVIQKAVFSAIDGFFEVMLDEYEVDTLEEELEDRGFEIIVDRCEPENFDSRSDRLKALPPSERLKLNQKVATSLLRIKKISKDEFCTDFERISDFKQNENLSVLIDKIERICELGFTEREEYSVYWTTEISSIVIQCMNEVTSVLPHYFDEPDEGADVFSLKWSPGVSPRQPDLLCTQKLSWLASKEGQTSLGYIFRELKRAADEMSRVLELPVIRRPSSAIWLVREGRNQLIRLNAEDLAAVFALYEFKAMFKWASRRVDQDTEGVLKLRW